MGLKILKFLHQKWGAPLILGGLAGTVVLAWSDVPGWGVLFTFGAVVIGTLQLLWASRGREPDLRTSQDYPPTSLGDPNPNRMHVGGYYGGGSGITGGGDAGY
ncbi:hypothetical protein [Roseovarius indicus]|uniref:hypothetical protein n=1 Tax=Roseovarius indicus TaxID=540747 RepID=UPI0010FD6F74|nr:hypothetical protein [Roseovarius indicus]